MICRTGLIVLAVLVCSCVGLPSPEEEAALRAKREQVEATRPTCEGEKDCAAKWDAAQLYVVKNSDFKIQTATNVLIETFSPSPGDLGTAISVTKEPLGGGRFKFVVRAYCYVCTRHPVEVDLDFNRQVAAATP